MIDLSFCIKRQGCFNARANGGVGEVIVSIGTVLIMALIVAIVFRQQVLNNLFTPTEKHVTN